MARLVDMRLEDMNPGDMIFPSSTARENPQGGGYVTWEGRPIPDSNLFPAIILDIKGDFECTVLSPTGVRKISALCLVSREKR